MCSLPECILLAVLQSAKSGRITWQGAAIKNCTLPNDFLELLILIAHLIGYGQCLCLLTLCLLTLYSQIIWKLQDSKVKPY